MRRFYLERTEDVSDVSGIGKVAEGIEFSDGTAVLRWLRAGGSWACYYSIKQIEEIHGHQSRTKMIFIDQ